MSTSAALSSPASEAGIKDSDSAVTDLSPRSSGSRLDDEPVSRRLSGDELREQNLARTLKSVDCKDLTMMQILALKSLDFTVPATGMAMGSCRLSAPPLGASMSRSVDSATGSLPSADHAEAGSSASGSTGGEPCASSSKPPDASGKWVQLAGHQQAFTVAPTGDRIWKRNDRNELRVYERLFARPEPITRFMPHFYRVATATDGAQYIELKDLLRDFHNPRLMDVKMGCRTFLEEEVEKPCARPDLYEKLVKIDQSAATAEEHAIKAVTKLR